MARLKNRTECPPGGFIVTIAQLNQTRQFWSFREAVDWYLAIATSNSALHLPTDPAKIANFIDQQNALRVMTIPGADIYLMQQKGGPELSPSKKVPLSNLPSRVAVAAAGITNRRGGDRGRHGLAHFRRQPRRSGHWPRLAQQSVSPARKMSMEAGSLSRRRKRFGWCLQPGQT